MKESLSDFREKGEEKNIKKMAISKNYYQRTTRWIKKN